MKRIIAHGIIITKFNEKELDTEFMAVYDPTPRYATLLPEIRITFIRAEVEHSLDYMADVMRLKGTDLAGRFVRDDKNPDYVVASDSCLYVLLDFLRLREYLRKKRDCIFILLNYECIEPDLNVFDYSSTWNPDLTCEDRIIRNVPYIIPIGCNDAVKNTLTLQQARRILSNSPKFCNFIYSHPCEPRDSFFRLLSQYKHVDSYGRHLRNTDVIPTREEDDWYNLSIKLKEGCKFSIAMENASSKGYTTEKIISSLQAHTVPIYWGDPAVADYINPKAFINCHDYSSPEEVIERVKEIDNDDEQWLDMVTQPWQTEEQHTRTMRELEEYYAMVRNIFTQDRKIARRRAAGTFPDNMAQRFTAYVGVMPSLRVQMFRKVKRFISTHIPKKTKLAIKRFFHMK